MDLTAINEGRKLQMSKRDLVSILDFSTDEFHDLMEKSAWIKNKFKNRDNYKPLDGMTMAMFILFF